MEEFKLKIIDRFAALLLLIVIYLDDIIDTIKTAVIALAACLIVTNFIFMPVKVSGTSMYPTLKDANIGFSNIIGLKTEGIQRFDIVIIHIDEKNENIVKRVIGLPGETISFIKDNLYVDGVLIEQDFLDEEYVQQQISESFYDQFTNDFTITLGEDEYFCMGDNRLVSLDSRYYGPFHSSQIIAKDVFTILPISEFGKAE